MGAFHKVYRNSSALLFLHINSITTANLCFNCKYSPRFTISLLSRSEIIIRSRDSLLMFLSFCFVKCVKACIEPYGCQLRYSVPPFLQLFGVQIIHLLYRFLHVMDLYED